MKSALLFAPLEKKWKEKKLLSFVSFDICVLFGLFIGCVLAFVFLFYYYWTSNSCAAGGGSWPDLTTAPQLFH